MIKRITSLKTLENYIIIVSFSTGEYKQFDLKPIIENLSPFKALVDVKGLYEQAKIDAGWYGIVWNDDLDLSAVAIYDNGKLVF